MEDLSDRFLWGSHTRVALADLLRGSVLGGRREELRGRSVLVATTDQLAAAVALVELDGVAARLILCPPDLPLQHLPHIMERGAVDAVVSDRTTLGPDIPPTELFVTCDPKRISGTNDPHTWRRTEWLLLTSGTTGLPKLVSHTLESLAGAIERRGAPTSPIVWGTFYDIRRYGGLQILLRAVLTGSSLALQGAHESVAEFLARAGDFGVTHISGTPSHWRRVLMSPAARMIDPRYIRMSGEIVDQAILGQLQSFYPQARIAHAFASTEAGVAFDVDDGLAGFPAAFVGRNGAEVELKVEDGSLLVRSARTASRYIGNTGDPLKGEDGFVDTRDMVELKGERYHFVGRRDGVINVGGLKVHPEEVEAVINRHPRVRVSLVRTRKSPLTGALVVAEIVLAQEQGAPHEGLKSEILQLCRESLPHHKVPAVVNFVPSLAVAATGKIARCHAYDARP